MDSARASKNNASVELQLSMVVLEVQNLEASVQFYRTLGLNIPDPAGASTRDCPPDG